MNSSVRLPPTVSLAIDATDCIGTGWSTTVLPQGLRRQLTQTSASDAEDVQQDLGLEIWRRAPRYDPDRGSFEAYANVVARSRAKNLSAARYAKKRDCRRDTSCLNEASAHESSAQKVDHVSDDVYRNGFGGEHQAACDRQGLAIDLRRALSKLPHRLRSVAEALAMHTKADAARQLGIARSTLYRLIAEIRTQFEADGLGAYLGLEEGAA